MTTAELLAEYAVAPRRRDDVLARAAARPFLDTLASAAAGWAEASSALAREWALGAVGTPGSPTAREWATGAPVLASEAAFANGVAAHALDLDDVSMSMWGHPSTLLVPVALAAGESVDAGVEDVLDAYLVGLQVDLAVAAGFDLVEHYARGWHASVTVGTIGAVAAAARLLGLTVTQTAYAIGLGVSMASGTRQNFGTTTKALHIGLAASNAIRAVGLVASGADASLDAIDGPLGFLALYGTDPRPDAVARALAEPEARALASLNTKRYPCCYQTHRAIDATLDLVDRLGAVGASDVEDVVVHVNPGSDNSLIHPYAVTATQGRFCMRYVVAAALSRGRVDFSSFADAEVNDGALQALMRRIRLEHAATPPYEPTEYALDYASVGVRLASGRTETATCVAARGSAERPMTDEELLAKAESCLTHAGAAVGAADLAGVLATPGERASRVVDLLSTSSEPAYGRPERGTG